MAHDVFVCYSSEDKTIANAACAKLESAGIRCWIAPRDPIAGIPYGRQLVDAITAARVVLLIFSGNANRSEHVLRELEVASDSGKIIVPFRIENVTPSGDLRYYITRVHWLDAMSPPMEARMNELVTLMQRLLEMPLTPAPAVAAATVSRKPFPVAAVLVAIVAALAIAGGVYLARRTSAPAQVAAKPAATAKVKPKTVPPHHAVVALSTSAPGAVASGEVSVPPTPRVVYVAAPPAASAHPAPSTARPKATARPAKRTQTHVAIAPAQTKAPAPQLRAPTLVTCQISAGQTLTFRQVQAGSWVITNSAVASHETQYSATPEHDLGGVIGTLLTATGRYNNFFIPDIGSSSTEIMRFGRTRDDPTERWVPDCQIATES